MSFRRIDQEHGQFRSHRFNKNSAEGDDTKPGKPHELRHQCGIRVSVYPKILECGKPSLDTSFPSFIKSGHSADLDRPARRNFNQDLQGRLKEASSRICSAKADEKVRSVARVWRGSPPLLCVGKTPINNKKVRPHELDTDALWRHGEKLKPPPPHQRNFCRQKHQTL